MPQNLISSSPEKIKTSLVAALFLVLFSISIAFGAVETFFRIIYQPSRQQESLPKTLIHQASSNLWLLYKPTPGLVYTDKEKKFTVSINSLGFRGREYSVQKPADTTRILFLGDSVTFGMDLDDKATIPFLLEKKFQKSGEKIEVLNFGVTGYETRQEVEFLKEKGLRMDPDLIVVGYTLNDCMHASMEIDTLENEGKWQIPTEEIPWEMRIPRFFYKHSRFLQYLDHERHLFDANPKMQGYLRGKKSVWHFIRDRNEKIKDAPDSEYQKLKENILEDGKKSGSKEANIKYALSFVGIDNYVMQSSHWNQTRKAYEELKTISEERGIPVIVIIYPFMIDLEHYALGSMHAFVKKEFEEIGFEVFDSLEAVKGWYRKYGSEIGIDPIHFSPKGTDLMADYIYERLGEFDFEDLSEISSEEIDKMKSEMPDVLHNPEHQQQPLPKKKLSFRRGRRPLPIAY